MSTKRKQFKPKAFKDHDAINNDFYGLYREQEVREKKRKQKSDGESWINDEEANFCSESCLSAKIMNMEIICSFCKNRFDDIKTLQNHTLQNHQQQKQQIVKMENEESDAILLNNEICRSTDVGPSLVCQQCDMTLHGFAEFGYHMRTHLISKNRKQKCTLCNVIFTDSIARISHIVEHFMENSIHIQCKECPAIPFYNFQQIRQHHSDAHLEILYRCAICHQIFSSQYHFQEHSVTHAEEVFRYHCVACSIQFETLDLLAIHVQLIHDRSAITLAINTLQRNLPENSFCKQVISRSENHLVKCLVCDIKFESEDELDFHRLITHCKVPRSNRCADCQKEIRTITHFKTHIREHMQNESTVTCIICRQALRNDGQIDTHAKYHLQLSDDTLEANQECRICQQMFGSESALQDHLHVHSTRAFRCDLCVLSFSSSQRFETHRKKHFAEKNFTCQICDLQFLNRDDLSIHVKMHGSVFTRCIAKPAMTTRFNQYS